MSRSARKAVLIVVTVVGLIWSLAWTVAWASGPGYAPERPGGLGDDPIATPRDATGRSIKCARVRAVHADRDGDEGTTGWLVRHDPWLAYQRGRELFLREFSAADGAFGNAGAHAGPVLEDQTTHMASRDHVASCALCHNVPFRDAGAGATIFKNGGAGRNTTHLFGGGLVEMIGWQMRQDLLALGDVNRDGFVGIGEADGVPARVVAADGRVVELGGFGDADGDGRPDLNPVCLVWYVDAQGKRISWARRLDEPGVAGYSFEVQVFGWGHRKGAMTSTLRAFAASAFDMHTGLQAHDPTLSDEPAGDGLAGVSLLGAQQFFTGRTRDRGAAVDARGVSLDDPDRDGVLAEISAGDLDLIELYMLDHPAPAEKAPTAERRRGRALADTLGCTGCHVPDWQLRPASLDDPDPHGRVPGDRRRFDLRVTDGPEGLVGRLVPVTRGAAARVTGVYSDFAHHDVGPGFHQVQFDGSVLTRFRTAPLWGVGTTAPYGHDGVSLDLDAVVLRHGGEAQGARDSYAALPTADRAAVIAWLRGLVLYAVDDVPADIDGDGRVAERFVVAGQDTGRERLNPEWLFRTPGHIEGTATNPDGVVIRSFALTNVRAAYGADLRWLRDDDGDGFPDALTPDH